MSREFDSEQRSNPDKNLSDNAGNFVESDCANSLDAFRLPSREDCIVATKENKSCLPELTMTDATASSSEPHTMKAVQTMFPQVSAKMVEDFNKNIGE